MTSLEDIGKVIYQPSGYFMAPNDEETVGDVPNVLFANGWIEEEGKVFIYYASSDTRCHVATSSVEKLVDFVKNSPQKDFTSAASVNSIVQLVHNNKGRY